MASVVNVRHLNIASRPTISWVIIQHHRINADVAGYGALTILNQIMEQQMMSTRSTYSMWLSGEGLLRSAGKA